MGPEQHDSIVYDVAAAAAVTVAVDLVHAGGAEWVQLLCLFIIKHSLSTVALWLVVAVGAFAYRVVSSGDVTCRDGDESNCNRLQKLKTASNKKQKKAIRKESD